MQHRCLTSCSPLFQTDILRAEGAAETIDALSSWLSRFTAFTGVHASKPQRQASTIVFTPRAMTLLDLDSRHRCLSAASCSSSSVIGPTGDAASPSCPCWHLAWPRGCPSLVWVISLPKISRGLQGNFAWGFVFWKSAPRKCYLSAAHGPLWEVF